MRRVQASVFRCSMFSPPQAPPDPPCIPLKKPSHHLPGTSSKRNPFKYSVSGSVEMIG